MPSAIFNLLSNLEPFNHEAHYDSVLLDHEWVLVNGIENKKEVYIFKADDVLIIEHNASSSQTTWKIIKDNTFTIDTEDGLTEVDAYFKDKDILVLNKERTSDCAVFINSNFDSDQINSVDDIQEFLKKKYKKKVTDLIHDHEFYYIQKSQEFGPNTVEELAEKVKNKTISAYCFVRDIHEYDYSKRLRVKDLISEL